MTVVEDLASTFTAPKTALMYSTMKALGVQVRTHSEEGTQREVEGCWERVYRNCTALASPYMVLAGGKSTIGVFEGLGTDPEGALEAARTRYWLGGVGACGTSRPHLKRFACGLWVTAGGHAGARGAGGE
jgi:hypothetical protein